MTTIPRAESIVEPAAPPEPEVAPETGPARADAHERSKSAPRRWWQRRQVGNPWRNEILVRLRQPGCFICREAETNLHRYYFWFLEEQYANFPTMDRLERAHGFCLRHTRHLLECKAPDRISYVAGYVLRYCADRLRSLKTSPSPERYGSRANRQPASRAFGPEGGCPACAEEQEGFRRYAEVIAGCLEERDVARAFRASGGLCRPHFLEAAHVAGWETLRCLAEEYLAWLGREIRECRLIEYRRWDQALYLCGQHAWLFADRCAPEILAVACDLLLDEAAGALRHLLREIREPISPTLGGRLRALPARWRESGRPDRRTQSRPPLSRRARLTLGTLWLTPQRFLDQTRERFLRLDRCPLCRHLETIEGRAADRLLAVLATSEGRAAFERSYGLCLHHAPILLERAGTPDLRRDIAAVLLARVEVDRWEAEEYLRKRSWSVRHEPIGSEEEAWLRASTRIAGVAMEQDYGF